MMEHNQTKITNFFPMLKKRKMEDVEMEEEDNVLMILAFLMRKKCKIVQDVVREKTRKCKNCDKSYEWEDGTYRPYDSLFEHTCPDCTQTCSLCGGENGYAKPTHLLTQNACSLCCKEPCMSCGLTIFCDECGLTCCEDCIDDGKCESCETVQVKIELVNGFK